VSPRTGVAVPWSASTTEIQNRCGSRSLCRTETHAAASASPASQIQERTRTVFPLPAGADIATTRAARWSRSNSARRKTIPSVTDAGLEAPGARTRSTP
jgi:hypothetical protein